MIILPDRNIPRAKFFMPVRDADWRTPSQAQPKNCFGHENQTLFSSTARRHDGSIVWRGWFEDRADFDAFTWAMATGSLRYERELWDLPTPAWRPYVGDDEDLFYDFITTVFITSGATYNVPVDCSGVSGGAGEFIDTIGAGASGGAAKGSGNNGTGGGGGAFSRVVSASLTPGGTVNIQIGTGGAARVATPNTATQGLNGNDTWFNGSSATSCTSGAEGGKGGAAGNGARNGGAGGATANGTGATKNAGGRGGNTTNAIATQNGTGAGGAAGPNGAGNQGVDTASSTNTATAGGSGDAGSGGAGGAGTTGSTGNVGSPGTEYTTHGSGGGGGGTAHITNNVTINGAQGGLYGGGGGGARGQGINNANSGAGRDGLGVLAYAPMSPWVSIAPIAGLA